MTDRIRAPWTPEQVSALNRFQQYAGMHPFTCGNEHDGPSLILMAHRDGWHCSDPACGYRQNWAHAFMANPDAWPKSPIRSYPDALRERAEADTDAIANPPIVGLAAPICPEHQPGAECPCPPGCHCCQPEPAPAATEATDPVTITDPAWLRQQYAAALREHGMVHLGDQVPADEYDCCADAVLAVRDRHLAQLRQRLTLADADLDRYEEHVVGDLNETNIGLARQAARAEQQRDQLAADLRYVLDYRGPGHAHEQPGICDDSGQPCAHCTRLEQARQHLANLTPTEA